MIEVDNNIKNILKLLGIDVPSNPKYIPTILKTLPININKVKSLVERDGATYVVESLLIYNKFLRTIKLTVSPQIGDQIIKVLRFNPEHLQTLLSCGYYTTGVTLKLRDEFINILVVSKDESHASHIKSMLENLR